MDEISLIASMIAHINSDLFHMHDDDDDDKIYDEKRLKELWNYFMNESQLWSISWTIYVMICVLNEALGMDTNGLMWKLSMKFIGFMWEILAWNFNAKCTVIIADHALQYAGKFKKLNKLKATFNYNNNSNKMIWEFLFIHSVSQSFTQSFSECLFCMQAKIAFIFRISALLNACKCDI